MAYLEVDYHGIMSEPMLGGTTVIDTALMIDLDVLTQTLKKCGIDPRGPFIKESVVTDGPFARDCPYRTFPKPAPHSKRGSHAPTR
jgi:hypothetical protein